MLHSDILSFIFSGTGWGVKIVVGSELSLDEVGLIMHIVCHLEEIPDMLIYAEIPY